MPETPNALSSPKILAVVVLYNREVSQSQTVSSLLQIVKQVPELQASFSLLIYDNSLQSHDHNLQTVLPIEYIHDSENGGLARAYNFALERAETGGRKWLLLLDQDTSLTPEFISELLQVTSALEAQSEVAAFVPKLVVSGEIHSPATSFISQIRRQFLKPKEAISRDIVGVQAQHLCSYNSGTTLRVSAVRSIGGFPSEFWLDFLDHAVFHALFDKGYRTYVMRAALEHDFSHTEIESVPGWRLNNLLTARTLYVMREGTFLDQLLYRLWLLRYSRRLRQSHKDGVVWRRTALQAFRFGVTGDLRRRPHP